jgi:hypothetical protein
MSTVTINVSVNKEGSVEVSPNPAKASVGDSIQFIPVPGVTINSITKNNGSDNVFSLLPSPANGWKGTIASNVKGKREKYTVVANGISHDPEMEIKS